MTDPYYWLYWLLTFLAVVAVLMVGCAIEEWFQWKRDGK